MNRKVFGLMLGVIGISFLVIMSFEAQASTLESMTAEASEAVYHHDLKVSASLNHLSTGEFGVLDDEIDLTRYEGCEPESGGIYTSLGGEISTEPFFDGFEECNRQTENKLLVTGLKNENNNEEFISVEVGE